MPHPPRKGAGMGQVGGRGARPAAALSNCTIVVGLHRVRHQLGPVRQGIGQEHMRQGGWANTRPEGRGGGNGGSLRRVRSRQRCCRAAHAAALRPAAASPLPGGGAIAAPRSPSAGLLGSRDGGKAAPAARPACRAHCCRSATAASNRTSGNVHPMQLLLRAGTTVAGICTGRMTWGTKFLSTPSRKIGHIGEGARTWHAG